MRVYGRLMQCDECNEVFDEYDVGVTDNDGVPDYCCPYCGSDRYGALRI